MDGVLVIDKPKGLTSHDVVGRLRRILNERRVGHAGTLDPMATGVLVAMLGEATKLSGYLTLDDKSYVARVKLGVATNTLDADGEVTQTAPLAPSWHDEHGRAHLERALAAERARKEQVPPAFAAIKVDGQRAYERARKGEPLELPPRSIRVMRLELTGLDVDDASLELELTVSKGYYVRALARDLGLALGLPAHLTALRRTASGPFTLARAVRLEDVHRGSPMVAVGEAARLVLPSVAVTPDGATRALHGKPLSPSSFVSEPPAACPCAWFDAEARLIAIGQRDGDTSAVLRGFRVA